MAEYTDEQLMSALRKAKVGGNVSAANELAAAIIARRREVKAQEPVDPLATIGDRYMASLDKREGQNRQNYDNMISGDTGIERGVFNTLGNSVAGTAGDLIGETVSSGLSAITHDSIEEPLKEFASWVAEAGVSSKGGIYLQEKWAALDPEDQESLAAAGNIASFLTAGLPKALFGSTITKALADRISNGRLSKSLKEPETEAVKLDRANGDMKVDRLHKPMTEEVAKIKGMDYKLGTEKKLNLIRDQRLKLDKKMLMQLRTKPTKVSVYDVVGKMDEYVDKMRKDNSWIQGNAAVDSAFRNHMDTVIDMLGPKEFITAEKVLHVRRLYDKKIQRSLKKAPEADLLARDAAGEAIRNALNDIVRNSAMEVGIDVGSTLKSMSLLYKARDNLAKTYSKENSLLANVSKYGKGHAGLVAATAVGSGSVATLAASPLIAGATLTGAGLYAGGRYAPNAMRGVARGLDPRSLALGAQALREEEEKGEVR